MSTLPPVTEERSLQEAADWLLLLGSTEISESDRQRWWEWVQACPDHARAWERIEAVSRKFSVVPPDVAADVLRPRRTRSRRAVRIVLPVLLLSWLATLYGQAHNQSAVWASEPGERRTQLARDGASITMNNAGLVEVRYGWRERLLQLREGEILIETAKDSRLWARPLVIETPHGRIEPLGTRFTVRVDGVTSKVTVFEGRVRLRPSRAEAAPVDLYAGTSGSLSSSAAPSLRATGQADAAWVSGLLVADDQPFCDFVAEMQRYRRERLACDPALQQRRISGVFELTDPQHALRAAATSMGLQLQPRPDGSLLVAPPR